MTISIAGRKIGPDQPPYVIAEMSGNHNGDINRAFALLEAAKAAGADAVKLQTYTADTMTIDHDGPGFIVKGGLWDEQQLYDLYKVAGTPWEWHEELFNKAAALDLTIFSTPFDPTAVDFLESLNAPAYKIASFELVDLPLIAKVASTGKPMIMSTGMATQEEIAEAVSAARAAGNEHIILLHCVSSYPTPPEQANIRTITDLAERYGTLAGLSDHTMGVTVPTVAVALGAVVIEKHFTLRRADGGVDSAFSLEAEELAEMCRNVRVAWQSLGQVHYGPTPAEVSNLTYRRSIYAVQDIPAGTPLTEENVRSIRPAFGLPPKHLSAVIGRKAKQSIPFGTPLSWDLVD